MDSNIRVKLEIARETQTQLATLCLKQLFAPDEKDLQRAGAHLGNMVNSLRAALNYAMVGFIDVYLMPVLDRKQSEKLRRQKDFPCTSDRTKFDELRIVTHLKQRYGVVYTFLEEMQPYHKGSEWLGELVWISNQDKHVLLPSVDRSVIRSFFWKDENNTPMTLKTVFSKDKVIVFPSRGKPFVVPVPSYFEPLKIYFSKDGESVKFFTRIEGNRLRETIQYTQFLCDVVEKSLDGFYALIEAI